MTGGAGIFAATGGDTGGVGAVCPDAGPVETEGGACTAAGGLAGSVRAGGGAVRDIWFRSRIGRFTGTLTGGAAGWVRGRRSGRRRGPFHEVQNLVAHLMLDGAELVFRVDAVLFAQGKEVLALHAQLPRKRENADFLFLLQAELPVLELLYIRSPPTTK